MRIGGIFEIDRSGFENTGAGNINGLKGLILVEKLQGDLVVGVESGIVKLNLDGVKLTAWRNKINRIGLIKRAGGGTRMRRAGPG